MRVFSTFSGISAASVAWQPLGFQMVGYCEPAAFPAHVLHQRLGATRPRYLPQDQTYAAKHYAGIEGGKIVNFGDITQITDDDLHALGVVDVLEGGSPCQSFSVAGLRKGLNDDRGNLALAFADLALRMKRINRTRFIIWENVTGVLSHEDNPLGCMLAAIAGADDPVVGPGKRWEDTGHLLVDDTGSKGDYVSIAWRVLDAQYFSVAQRRTRLFLVASFDPDVDAGRVLFERDCEAWDPASGRGTQQAGSGDCSQGPGAITALLGMDSDTMIRVDPAVAFALKASNFKNVQAVIYPRVLGTREVIDAGVARQANELDLVVGENQEDARGDVDFVCRRLMPVECERLQGFEDGWTDIEIDGKRITDGHRYKALGNSMAIPCLRFIGYRLQRAVDAAVQSARRSAA